MLEKLAEALNAIHRVPTQLLIVLAVASSFILFIPEDLAVTLAVDEFRKSYRIYLGPGLVVVGAWLVARLLAAIARPLQERKKLRKLHEGLSTLTPQEKGYLVAFIHDENTTINVPVEDGIIGGLLARRIVFRSSNVFDFVDGVPYNLQPWARARLLANPRLLDGAARRP